MARPSNSELDDVAAHLLLFKTGPTALPLPLHDPSTNNPFDFLMVDTRFTNLSLAIIQYAADGSTKTFLHNPDVNWDIGSGGKLSIAIAALSLLRDIRSMTNVGVVAGNISNAKLDALLRHVWGRHPARKIKRLGRTGQFPLPSKMFDVAASPVRFRGFDAIDFAALKARSRNGHSKARDLVGMNFGERLHLTMGFSDNRAARSCQGNLGIGFINAVVAKLGLFDEATGTGIKVSGPYSTSKEGQVLPSGFRQPIGISRAKARASSRATRDGRPYVATARTLAALMIAIMGDGFLDIDISAQFRSLLLVRPEGLSSHALNGMMAAASTLLSPFTAADEEFSKIGALWSNAEFVHVNVHGVRYSLIALGLLDDDALFWQDRAIALGSEVHTIIMP